MSDDSKVGGVQGVNENHAEMINLVAVTTLYI